MRAAPTAAVATYDGWDVRRLARHLGQVQRWVTGVVTERATERPAAFPPAEDDDDRLADWLGEGAVRLTDALAALPPDTPLWTISRGDRSCGFWRRRMVFESVLHGWDADTAVGRAPAIPPALAAAGAAEALDVYVGQRLRDQPVGGHGQRVTLVADGRDAWTLTLHEHGVELVDGAAAEADVTLTAPPLVLWLLVTGRAGLDDAALSVEGDASAAELAVTAMHGIPGPAG